MLSDFFEGGALEAPELEVLVACFLLEAAGFDFLGFIISSSLSSLVSDYSTSLAYS